VGLVPSGELSLQCILVDLMPALQAHASAVKWRTKSFPLYDEMLALVEGRHATGENVFRVTQLTPADAKLDEDEDSEDERNSHGIERDNSFKTNGEGPGSAEQSFEDDWVHHSTHLINQFI
jgi:hypothetical protein